MRPTSENHSSGKKLAVPPLSVVEETVSERGSGSWEIALRLKALAALAGAPGSVPSRPLP